MSGSKESKYVVQDPDLHLLQLDRAYTMRGRKKIYTI
jgi:hypothetical protein